MSRLIGVSVGLLLPLLLGACSSPLSGLRPTPFPHQPRPIPLPSAFTAPTHPTPPLAPPSPLHFNVETIASGLQVPWSLVFLPDGGMLLTERTGRVRIIENGQLQAQPALALRVASAPGVESGLLGIALHPGFPNPPDVYVYYTRWQGGAKVNRVSRFTYGGGRLRDEKVVVDGIPGGDCCHFGGRIKFGPDGMLYVTTGDGQQPGRAADTRSPNGKILRVYDDGSIPRDNPFPGSPVWAWGLRNPQGLAWDAAGRLYVSNHGPTGEFGLFHNDEIDLIQRGAFYGWPVKAGTTTAANPHDYGNPPSLVPPAATSGNSVTWAPSGMTFYAPNKSEQPTLLVAALFSRQLLRFIINPGEPGHATGPEMVLSGFGRMRDAVAGPDGCVYVLTSNRDGRGTPQPGDDKVLRLCPQ